MGCNDAESTLCDVLVVCVHTRTSFLCTDKNVRKRRLPGLASATLAGGAAEVATAAQPLLEALQRMEGRLSAIELKQDVAASGCCVLM